MGSGENGRVHALGESEKVIVKIIVSFTGLKRRKRLSYKEWNGENERGRSRKI